MNTVKLVENSEWDKFTETSPQGTIFCTTKWMGLFDDRPFKVYGYYRNGELIGGIPIFEGGQVCLSGATPLTPFQGILVCPISGKDTTTASLHNEVATALIEELKQHYKFIRIFNHYTFPDIRPFLWAGWKSEVKYTYVIDLSNKGTLFESLEKQTRYEIGKARRDGIEVTRGNITQFDDLYTQTFERKGMERPVSSDFIHKFNEVFNPDIFIAQKDSKPIASAVIMYDSKRAYYIFGASSEGHASSLVLWEALPDKGEIDLVGCNDKNIALFKRGFGGKLVAYYGVLNV